MKTNLTELVFILDKSGSMSGLENDTIGGFNSLIEKQKKEEGEAIVTTILFNHSSEMIHERINIKDVPLLTNKEYYVNGCTALLDAIGNTINQIIRRQFNDENKPNKTLFIITTDGEENSSKEFDYSKVKQLIETVKKDFNYEFIFLGANIDTVKEAKRFGINVDNAVSYNCDSRGIDLNYKCLSDAISYVRKNEKLSKEWREKIDFDFEDRKNN